MQAADSRREREAGGAFGRLAVACGRWLRLSAATVWLGVGGYSQYRPVTVVPYTVGLVGAAVSLTLVATLLEDGTGSENGGIPPTGRRSNIDRLVGVGCLIGIAAGTAGVVSAAGGIPAAQPQFADSALIAGGLVVGALLILVGWWFGPVAGGLAVGAVGVGWLTAPTDLSLIETMVYDSRGIYGPLTRAAASWIAPACLLAGLWQATGTVDRLRRLVPTITADATTAWLSGRRLSTRLWQLTPSVGVVSLLMVWQLPEVDVLRVVVAAAIPAASCWLGLIVAGRFAWTPIEFEGSESVNWRGPLLVAGGPLAVMALLVVVARLPFETLLLVGSLVALGGCVLGPAVGVGRVDRTSGRPTDDRTSGRLRTGVGAVLDGSVVGLGLFARLAVLLAVVGGVTVVVQTTLSTQLLSVLLWLPSWSLLAVLVVVGCCLVGGLTLPVVAGYAAGAVVGVPLLVTLTSESELTAQLVVWSAVVGGWLVAPAVDRRLQAILEN